MGVLQGVIMVGVREGGSYWVSPLTSVGLLYREVAEKLQSVSPQPPENYTHHLRGGGSRGAYEANLSLVRQILRVR